MRAPLVVLALFAAGTPAAAQAPRPLDKVEVIRLLTNPLFAQSEVADVVRRSCVGFRPTERDWADLRNAGAGGEVIASVAACTARRTAPPAPAPAAPPAPLTAVAVPSNIVTPAGSPASVRVFVHRGGTPQGRVPLTLRGTASVGLQRDAAAVTDDSGMAVFPLPPVGQPGTHRFEILGKSGATFPGRPTVSFVVRPGEPGRLRVTPDYIASVESGVTVVVTVSDSLGNPLSKEPVELTSGVGASMSAATDSLGRASFVLVPNALPRGGALRVRVRALPPVEVTVADAAGLSGTATGFRPGSARRGRVGSPLGEPLIFQARTVQGHPASGRSVHFRGVNARVTPDSTIIDSTGRVALEVTIGARAGEAMIVARIDSVEKLVTVPVDPGPIMTLVLEYGGRPVTSKRIVVPVAVPFVLRLTARDFYGNETPIGALGQMLRSGRAVAAPSDLELDVLSLDVGDSAVLISLKARRLGMYDFTVGSGITASLRVEAVRAPS